MSWVKIDDRFPDHPKVIGLSDKAFRAYIVGLCYAAKHETDGWLPPAVARDREASELLNAGLWCESVASNGWWIHDYLAYNRSRADAQALREVKRSAGRSGGVASGQARAKQSASPSGSELLNSRTRTRTTEGLRPSAPNGAIVSSSTTQQAMFGSVCEAMGYDVDTLGPDDQREIGGIAAALVAKGLHAEEVLPYVEWLVGSESPIVGGRRLTLHSVPKWVKDWRAAPRVVNSNGRSKADRMATIQRNLAEMQARGAAVEHG